MSPDQTAGRVSLLAGEGAATENIDSLREAAGGSPVLVDPLVVLQRIRVDVERPFAQRGRFRGHVDAVRIALRLIVVGPDRVPAVWLQETIVVLLERELRGRLVERIIEVVSATAGVGVQGIDGIERVVVVLVVLVVPSTVTAGGGLDV